MIDSGSRSQVRPLESFKRSRFGLLAIASFIIQYPRCVGNAATLAKGKRIRHLSIYFSVVWFASSLQDS
jgi:hypothetical protein